MLERLAVVAPLADFDLANLLLQLLKRFAELAQVAALLAPLFEVVRLGLADLGRAGREEGFVFGVPGRDGRNVCVVRVQERDLELLVEGVALRRRGSALEPGRYQRALTSTELLLAIIYWRPDAARSWSPLSPAPLTLAHSSSAPANAVVAVRDSGDEFASPLAIEGQS